MTCECDFYSSWFVIFISFLYDLWLSYSLWYVIKDFWFVIFIFLILWLLYIFLLIYTPLLAITHINILCYHFTKYMSENYMTFQMVMVYFATKQHHTDCSVCDTEAKMPTIRKTMKTINMRAPKINQKQNHTDCKWKISCLKSVTICILVSHKDWLFT